MARSRNIKPGFFTNDVLGELPALTRLLFAGMWTICDRAGRLEDRPKKIRAEVLPYDDCDPEAMLQDLEKHGFILRYEAGGMRAIQVLAWDKHQNPHIKEGASTIPAPQVHGASTVQEQFSEQPLPERAGLIPDSGFLTTDSSPINTSPIGDGGTSDDADGADNCPQQKIIEAYHRLLPSGRQVREWTPARGKALRTRWREKPQRQKLEWWERFFAYVSASDFLTGRTCTPGRKPFLVSLDWLVKAENMAKVIEGAYENEREAA